MPDERGPSEQWAAAMGEAINAMAGVLDEYVTGIGRALGAACQWGYGVRDGRGDPTGDPPL